MVPYVAISVTQVEGGREGGRGKGKGKEESERWGEK